MILLNREATLSQQWDWINSESQLKQHICDYFKSNPVELSQIVSSSGINDVQCDFSSNESTQGWTLDNQTLNVTITPQAARRLQANVWAFRWSSGVLTTPTIVGLVRTGIMDYVSAPESEATIAQIGDALCKTDSRNTYGNIWGALHLLELQGWAQRKGRDNDAVFFLTRLGNTFMQLVRQYWETILEVNDDIAAMQHYHALCHNQYHDKAAIARFRHFIDRSNDNWDLPVESDDPIERTAAQQLVNCLDGLFMGSAMVAMGMPVYEKQGARIIPVTDSALAHFMGDNKWVQWGQLPANFNREFIEAAFTWLEQRQLAKCDDDAICLTPQGQIQLAFTPPLAALGVSYLRSYEHIDDLLIGSGDPCGIDNDSHVDRVMNVYGSSGAGSGPGSVIINEKIINHYFNVLPLEQQPAGIADIGCGDGTSLKRLADYVIEHTQRGKALAEYPLVVIGADYNDAPLELTRETLAAYDDIEGVKTLVVKADISNPDAYNDSLKASGVAVKDFSTGEMRPLQLDDVLHTYMFLIHNRRLCVNEVDQAREIIGKTFAAADKQRMNDAFITYFGRTLPEDDQVALAAVLDTFDMSFSGSNGLVPGVVAVADLVDFMLRWKPYAKHGLISLEGHSPSRYDNEETIDITTRFLRADKLPHPLNWGMHFQSHQFMLPFNQYMLAMTLAGFRPHDNHVYGSINPSMLPNIDQLPQHRFFSIGCYVPDSYS